MCRVGHPHRVGRPHRAQRPNRRHPPNQAKRQRLFHLRPNRLRRWRMTCQLAATFVGERGQCAASSGDGCGCGSAGDNPARNAGDGACTERQLVLCRGRADDGLFHGEQPDAPLGQKYVSTKSDSLAMRQSPNAGASIVQWLPRGALVTFISQENGWVTSATAAKRATARRSI